MVANGTCGVIIYTSPEASFIELVELSAILRPFLPRLQEPSRPVASWTQVLTQLSLGATPAFY